MPEASVKLAKKEITYRDDVHGDVRLDAIAVSLLDTSALQRLGRVYQLGYAHLVYRGGNHTRLSHVLGAYHVAGKLVDAVRRNYAINPAAWPVGVSSPDEFLPGTSDHSLEDRWVVLRMLVGWAALLHDVGHVPLGHTLEDEFAGIFKKHDSFDSPRMPFLWHTTSPGVDSEIKHVFLNSKYPAAFGRMNVPPARVWQCVMAICLHKDETRDGKRVTFRDLLSNDGSVFAQEVLLRSYDDVVGKFFFPYMADIVANTICADYLDYMQRDPQNLGLDVLHDDRVISQFWIASEGENREREQLRMALSLVDRRGKPRLDTTTGVVDLVRQRYRFAEIVYYHKTKAAASAMTAKAFQLLGIPKKAEDTDQHILHAPTLESVEMGIEHLTKAKSKLNDRLRELRREFVPFAEVSTELDLLDPHLGDESMLVTLVANAWDEVENSALKGKWDDVRNYLQAIVLLSSIMYRRLYKVCFTMDRELFAHIKPGGTQDAVVEEELPHLIQKIRKDVAFRSSIEARMAQAVGLPINAFILYVPPLKSQAKGIETRALDYGSVTTLGKHSAVREEVRQLGEKYARLWRLIAFVHPDHANEPIKLSKALDELVTAMFSQASEGAPAYVVTPKVQAQLSFAAWFDYVPRQDRPAAEMYAQWAERLPVTRWGMRSLVEARTTAEGNLTDEEQVNRALLIELSSTEGISLDVIRNAVMEQYPEPGSVLSAAAARSPSQLEFREGVDEFDLRMAALKSLADELRGSLA